MMYTMLNQAPHTTTDTFSHVQLSARLAAIRAARRTPMAHWQSGDVEANGLRLHYTRTGGAKPPVVLAHGFSDDGLCWTPLAEALAPDYDAWSTRAGTGDPRRPRRAMARPSTPPTWPARASRWG